MDYKQRAKAVRAFWYREINFMKLLAECEAAGMEKYAAHGFAALVYARRSFCGM
jgi:hypothetical protein